VSDTNAKLVGLSGPLKGTTFLLPQGEICIGRDASNQLWVGDPALSRRHCAVYQREGRFIIRDLDSHNGTLLNGTKIREQELHHRDQISIGDSVLTFLTADEADNLEKTTVEIADTAELGGAPVLLRPEDAVYLHPEKQTGTSRAARDLNALLKIATGIGAIRDRDALEWQLLGMIFEVIPAHRGAVLHFAQGGQEIISAVAWDRVRGPGEPVRVSRSVVNRVLQDRSALMVTDVAADGFFTAAQTLNRLEIKSLLCAPLIVSGKALGLIYVDSRDPKTLFDPDHLQFLSAVASLAALALDNVRHWERLNEENRMLRAEINLEHDMVGNSLRMAEVLKIIHRVAPTNSTVLIQGESGTGKELVARAIHRNSPRAERPFVAINCAALTETLLESELFGHEKGSFTGAVAQKKGKIELAEGGTLFLDEIGELGLGLQAKLLRVLQERELERVGATRAIPVDVRLIAATNRNLADAVQAGQFRDDLFYRLNVVAINMPALRERREDIPALAEHFVAKYSKKLKTRVKTLSPEARAYLVGYDWPGNVRELENAIERALVLGTAEVILTDDLPEAVLESESSSASLQVPAAAKYHGAVKDSKKQLVIQAMQQANGNYIDAAKILGIHPNSLLRLIRNLGLKSSAKAISSPPAAD